MMTRDAAEAVAFATKPPRQKARTETVERPHRMTFPESTLPRRSREQSAALSRRSAQVDPSQKPDVPLVVRWQPDGTLTLPLAAFASMDFGQLCQRFGLSPSRPRRGRRR